MENFFEIQFKEAIRQLHAGLALRVDDQLVTLLANEIKVADKAVVHLSHTPDERHLIITLADLDPDIWAWEDNPRHVWTVDLFQDFDLIEEIEVVADHVIGHVNRLRMPVDDGLLDDPEPDPALLQYLGFGFAA